MELSSPDWSFVGLLVKDHFLCLSESFGSVPIKISFRLVQRGISSCWQMFWLAYSVGKFS